MKKSQIRRKNEKKSDFYNSLTQKEVKKLTELKIFQQQLIQKYGHNAKEIVEDISIPLSVFSTTLGPLEAVCTYLKQIGYKNKEIAQLTGRSEKTVWATLHKVKKKHPQALKIAPSRYFIPLKLIRDRSRSVLEHIVSFLVILKLSHKEIAKILNRNPSTIHTTHTRAQKKV